MKFYAQLNKYNKVIGVSQLNSPVSSDDMVEIDSINSEILGSIYDRELKDFIKDSNITEEKTGTKITRLAFRQRFTIAEKVGIETAAETDITVRVMMKDQDAATYIDLSRQDTIDGVNYLVSQGLLTQDRADEILNAPVQPVELPQ